MIRKNEYVEYLLSTPINYPCTNLAEHKPPMSHDVVSDFLRQERFKPADLWEIVQPHLQDSAQSFILADASVQDKGYSYFIELVKRQYSGNEHTGPPGGTVKGIGLLNRRATPFVHSAGADGDFWPIDYRIYHPGTDGKTKNDHFQEMFMRLVTHKRLQARTILFDSWYASVTNLKLIDRHGWTFFTTLKSNRLVSVSRDVGYQHLDNLIFDEVTLVKGLLIKLKEIPFLVKLFNGAAPNGDIEWVITNDLSSSVNVFVAEINNGVRCGSPPGQIEDFHRSFKQLTGSEKCQCRKARSQRNHLACCYHAWVSLRVKAKQVGQTIYQLRKSLFTEYLVNELANPTIQAI